MKNFLVIATILSVATPIQLQAEIIGASDTHFVLHHEASSTLKPNALWQRLIQPATWWHPDHTYSGRAVNLSLKAEAGGLWRETWEGGSVTHGTVVFVKEGEVLRLNAPFGPLQELGAYTIWTITISPTANGSTVVFDEVSTGPPSAKMAEIAKAVDYVKGEAIKRLSDQSSN